TTQLKRMIMMELVLCSAGEGGYRIPAALCGSGACRPPQHEQPHQDRTALIALLSQQADAR
ncbi:MAG: hypothetical protein RBS88_11815, partial [Spongiibacteraceae bacterium]|nr:hypothetical protein [Spongiibacteraceae bacterium]